MALMAEEGRGKLRKAAGRSKHPENRGYPNGVTRLVEDEAPRKRRQPGEVKHLSNRRRRNRRDAPSSGERNGQSLNRVRAKPAGVA